MSKVQKDHTKIINIPATAVPKGVELSINPEKVFFIIVKAREFDVKVPPVEPDPGSNPSDHQERGVLEDYADDATFAELTDALNGLNDDEKADLVAMLWIGRGDYDASEWQQARKQAVNQQHHVASYLTGTPLLGDLLEDGLAALGYSTEEFELNRL